MLFVESFVQREVVWLTLALVPCWRVCLSYHQGVSVVSYCNTRDIPRRVRGLSLCRVESSIGIRIVRGSF